MQPTNKPSVNWQEFFETLGAIYWHIDYYQFLQLTGFDESDYALNKFKTIQAAIKGLSCLDNYSWQRLIQGIEGIKNEKVARSRERLSQTNGQNTTPYRQAMVKALAIHPRDETEQVVKTAGFIPQ
ncbi:hypothetical protein [Coleofasciculus sp.]|uniref:hypothetical protein n=1 Tax=Coleofasciculus sp. TaxID=3100458 RepID=UPI004064228F